MCVRGNLSLAESYSSCSSLLSWAVSQCEVSFIVKHFYHTGQSQRSWTGVNKEGDHRGLKSWTVRVCVCVWGSAHVHSVHLHQQESPFPILRPTWGVRGSTLSPWIRQPLTDTEHHSSGKQRTKCMKRGYSAQILRLCCLSCHFRPMWRRSQLILAF